MFSQFVLLADIELFWTEEILEFFQLHHTERADAVKLRWKIILYVVIFSRPENKIQKLENKKV
jgi:hypothetical protein